MNSTSNSVEAGGEVPRRAKRFARANAIGAILLSLAGNAAWHLVSAKLLTLSWVVGLIVGAVPALVLGLVSHLAALRRQADAPVLQAVPGTSDRIEDGPRYGSQDELISAARAADVAHRAEHGKPITRDELRRALRIGGQKATEALRALRQSEEPG